MILSKRPFEFKSNDALECGYPPFIYPEELRGNLLNVVENVEKFRLFGIPAAMGGSLILRDKGNSCFDVLPMGPMRLWYSFLIKFELGSTAALDWREIYTTVLAYYKMWLDSHSRPILVLNPDDLYAELKTSRLSKIPSRKYFAPKTKAVILNSKVVCLQVGDWYKDSDIINRVNQWKDRGNWCRCEKRFQA